MQRGKYECPPEEPLCYQPESERKKILPKFVNPPKKEDKKDGDKKDDKKALSTVCPPEEPLCYEPSSVRNPKTKSL